MLFPDIRYPWFDPLLVSSIYGGVPTCPQMKNLTGSMTSLRPLGFLSRREIEEIRASIRYEMAHNPYLDAAFQVVVASIGEARHE